MGQRSPMHGGAIAFMTGETITGVAFVKQPHQAVTSDFGNY